MFLKQSSMKLHNLASHIRRATPLSLKTSKHILKGVGTYLPEAVRGYLPQHMYQFYGNSVRVDHDPVDIARGLYSAWLRYLVVLHDLNEPTEFENIGEIGPGDSLGIGLLSLLCGGRQFFAMDVVPYAYMAHNEAVLDELIKLFRQKSPIPDNAEFRKHKPLLNSYAFPSHIFSDARLQKMLEPERINAIRSALRNISCRNEPTNNGISITYMVPWDAKKVMRSRTLDLLLSNAAMEHVDSIEKAYSATDYWLKDGGLVVHNIDYKCHETSSVWNGHWTYGPLLWRAIKGATVYLINREPHSAHLRLLNEHGFSILRDDRFYMENTLTRDMLAKKFEKITDEDMKTFAAFIIAKKNPSSVCASGVSSSVE